MLCSYVDEWMSFESSQTMTKKLTKKEAKAFWDKIHEVMKPYSEIERFENDDGKPLYTQWLVPSRLGNIQISLFADPCFYYCVYLRFLDKHDFAKEIGLSMVNPYSGKWNITETTMDGALIALAYRLALMKVTSESKEMK